jgi:hypothetical protein
VIPIKFETLKPPIGHRVTVFFRWVPLVNTPYTTGWSQGHRMLQVGHFGQHTIYNRLVTGSPYAAGGSLWSTHHICTTGWSQGHRMLQVGHFGQHTIYNRLVTGSPYAAGGSLWSTHHIEQVGHWVTVCCRWVTLVNLPYAIGWSQGHRMLQVGHFGQHTIYKRLVTGSPYAAGGVTLVNTPYTTGWSQGHRMLQVGHFIQNTINNRLVTGSPYASGGSLWSTHHIQQVGHRVTVCNKWVTWVTTPYTTGGAQGVTSCNGKVTKGSQGLSYTGRSREPLNTTRR